MEYVFNPSTKWIKLQVLYIILKTILLKGRIQEAGQMQPKKSFRSSLNQERRDILRSLLLVAMLICNNINWESTPNLNQFLP